MAYPLQLRSALQYVRNYQNNKHQSFTMHASGSLFEILGSSRWDLRQIKDQKNFVLHGAATRESLQLAFDRIQPVVSGQIDIPGEKPARETLKQLMEAYCELVNQKNVRWQNRAHFFAIAPQLMRRILIDHAKTQTLVKRGGNLQKLTLDSAILISPERAVDLMALDDALKRLAEFDEQKSRIVEMKFFGGLTTEEIAEVEHISKTTVEREWRRARAWLFQEMRS